MVAPGVRSVDYVESVCHLPCKTFERIGGERTWAIAI